MDSFARRIVSEEAKLQQDHSARRAGVAVEIPAPSAELSSILTDRKSHDLKRLTTDKALAAEFTALRQALEAALSHDEKRPMVTGDETKLAPLAGPAAPQVQILTATYRQGCR